MKSINIQVSTAGACAARMVQAAPVLQDHERQPCEIWTRVMGYHRPVSEFNLGKQAEHHERVHFVEARANQ